MFGFMGMTDNYEDRLIKNTKAGKAEIDTAAVGDSDQPYETGIKHPLYNDGGWVIVEMYDSKEDAKKGHQEWVDIFSKDELPNNLKDVSTFDVKQMFGGDDEVYEKQDA
jgi:hypothetical protein